MDLGLPIEVAENYTSISQRIRVMTEYWVNESIYCPNCGHSLSNFENNKPVADFYCRRCLEEYELKSKQGIAGTKIVNGAFSTMIQRITSNKNPSFFILTYDKYDFSIKNFFAIPKYFFIANIIEKRKPLSATARRAGWIGCNIVIRNIPDLGKIYYVQDGIAKSRKDVLENWRRTAFVRSTRDVEAKGWLLDVLLCVERMSKIEFTLEELYSFEPYLKTKHPLNHNIQAKIRQQLQVLRDRSIIDFVGHGNYSLRKR